jgi:hypothetical protein
MENTGRASPRVSTRHVLAQIKDQPHSRASSLLFESITNVDPYELDSIFRHRTPVPEETSAREIRDHLAELFSVPKAAAADLLDTSQSRLSRSDRVDIRILDRTYAIIRTFVSVAAVLGTKDAASWFKAPNPALDNEAPLGLLGTSYGEKRVENLIEGLLSGAIV